MSLPRYAEYKASGVEWLGKIPKHWVSKRLKQIYHVYPSNVDKKSYDEEQAVRLCNYTDVYYNDVISAGIEFMSATASADQIARFELHAGDTLITKDSETADDIAISAYVPKSMPGVVCGYHLAVVRPRERVVGAFIKRLFDSSYLCARFEVLANGLTRVGLSQYALDNVDVPVPPPTEQIAIAGFLDRETGKIDALVAEQEKLIALLKEKRQAVISHAVTKGLNPDAPMTPSGIEWLGDVPAHWEVKALKFVARVQTGIAKGKDNEDRNVVSVPYLRVANVQDGYFDLTEVAMIEIAAYALPRYLLRSGDVLMNEGGDFDKLGRGHVWQGEIDPCIHQNHVFAVRPVAIPSEWLNLVTGSDYAQFYFMTRSKQSTNLASISSTNLMELPMLIPPEIERNAIIEFMEAESSCLDVLNAEANRTITLLKERRSALISAAVTGQIDVRGLVPQQAEAA